MKPILLLLVVLVFSISSIDKGMGKETQTHAACSSYELSGNTGHVWYSENC